MALSKWKYYQELTNVSLHRVIALRDKNKGLEAKVEALLEKNKQQQETMDEFLLTYVEKKRLTEASKARRKEFISRGQHIKELKVEFKELKLQIKEWE